MQDILLVVSEFDDTPIPTITAAFDDWYCYYYNNYYYYYTSSIIKFIVFIDDNTPPQKNIQGYDDDDDNNTEKTKQKQNTKEWWWHVGAGSFILYLIGASLHFVYQWSTCNRWIAIFGAVNESTYEHVKICMWPLLLWHLGHSYKLVGRAVIAAVVAALVMIAVNAVNRAANWEPLVFDLVLFWFAIVVGQAAAMHYSSLFLAPFALFFFLVLMLMLSTFTFAPPAWPVYLFGDPTHNNTVGIPSHCGT